MLDQIKRNSGATLLTGGMVLKNGLNVRDQGRRMMRFPYIFAPVLSLTDDGYVMEWYHDGQNCADRWREAVVLLDKLWKGPPMFSKSSYISREAYHQSLRAMCMDTEFWWLTVALDKAYEGIRAETPNALNLHGDATLENVVALDDYTIRWIDPSVRPVVCDKEVDAAKLLWSALGYECGVYQGLDSDLAKYVLYSGNFMQGLVLYHFIGHVIRSWRKQPLKREWFVTSLYHLGLV